MFAQNSLAVCGIGVALMGAFVFFAHSFSLNAFLRNRNMVAMSLMLPVIALVITKTIATNFFLSLGMIGALSIIRYRTPVKSGYELSLLFGLITIGIVAGVHLRHAVYLTLFLASVGPLLKYLSAAFPRLIRPEVGQTQNHAEAILRLRGSFEKPQQLKDYFKYLRSYDESKAGKDVQTTLVFVLEDMEQALEFKNRCGALPDVIEINLGFSSV
ncbi:MAG: DUF4956 domain-containing protein [Elusimicrobiota bacterium]